ncbi:MAG TPA: 16S rRNA (guanine(966)-N(2))-methyltransferase RsmD [Gemmatimonadales bacterium]|nr:16S rRNA (guanine(966)-N(2))-methyltransferase RsmD [Gemmatimonadales bacterium]
MTRIIAGEFRGRRLSLPADARVRPTADRVREAWMSILGDRLAGAELLDLFSGSGALGLEALSRGARHVTFVEMAAPSLDAIRENVEALGVAGRVTLHRGDAMRFVERTEPGRFDLALADPPYSIPFAERLVDAFRSRPFARLLAVEHPARVSLAGDDTRRYGDIALTFCHSP